MGGWATDALAKRGVSSGGWASQALAGRGASATEEEPLPEVGVTLEGLDAERAAKQAQGFGFAPWEKPGDAGSPTLTQAVPEEERFTPIGYTTGDDTRMRQHGETLTDAGYSAAGGVLGGIGINPKDLSPGIANRLEVAETRTPTGSMLGRMGGELAIQTAAAPAKLLAAGPVAMGAVSGGLSGAGGTQGDLLERIQGTAKGAGLGALLGKAFSGSGHAMQSLEDPLERVGNRQYLRQGGATTGDLNAFDQGMPGGAQGLAERSRAQGIGDGFLSGPQGYQNDAQKIIGSADAERSLLSQGAGPLDPMAVPASMERAGYQGVPNTTIGLPSKIRAAVDAEAGGMRQLGSPQKLSFSPSGGVSQVPAQGIPFEDANNYRKILGNKTNWTNEPGDIDAAMQRVHGALNDEMADGLSLANPGSGDRWRQLGRNERDAIGIQNMGARAENRGGGMGVTDAVLMAGGMATGQPAVAAAAPVAGRAMRAMVPAAAKNAAFAGAGMARAAGDFADSGLSNTLGGVLASESTRGPDLDQIALDVVHAQGPELGRFTNQFAQAAGAEGTDNVKNLISKLIQTEPDFRMQVLPALRKRGMR